VTVLDHANGMATFAAGGQRAQAHFVREVTKRGERVYAERLVQSDTGLSPIQVDELTWALGKVKAAKLDNGWDAAGKTGTWQSGNSRNSGDTWMVGYTPALATAVWLGTTDGVALKTMDGRHDVSGSTHAAPIWRQFTTAATSAMGLDPDTRQSAHHHLPPRHRRSPAPDHGSSVHSPGSVGCGPTSMPRYCRTS
jgi:membrane peptidoglycan carboxypeptidase